MSIFGKIRDGLVEAAKNKSTGFGMNDGIEMGPVINPESKRRIEGIIAKGVSEGAGLLLEGRNTLIEGYESGNFIKPTILENVALDGEVVSTEIFGPVMTIYVYPDEQYAETLDLCDQTSPYALTGAVFASERSAVSLALSKLENAAGNFYINDKPTGAVVGQQPFGGARASGTNDKAGARLNLLRWVSPRTIKETFDAAESFEYPFMDEE